MSSSHNKNFEYIAITDIIENVIKYSLEESFIREQAVHKFKSSEVIFDARSGLRSTNQICNRNNPA